MHLLIKDCTDEEFAAATPLLREEDKEEWRLWAGDTPEGLVAGGFRLKRGTGCINRIGFSDETGEALALWGCNPLAGSFNVNDPKLNTGWVWLAAMPAAYKVAKQMHRHLWDEFQRMQGFYEHFYTQSWDGNPHHQLWLKWMGFEPGVTMRHANGADFTSFTYRS